MIVWGVRGCSPRERMPPRSNRGPTFAGSVPVGVRRRSMPVGSMSATRKPARYGPRRPFCCTLALWTFTVFVMSHPCWRRAGFRVIVPLLRGLWHGKKKHNADLENRGKRLAFSRATSFRNGHRLRSRSSHRLDDASIAKAGPCRFDWARAPRHRRSTLGRTRQVAGSVSVYLIGTSKAGRWRCRRGRTAMGGTSFIRHRRRLGRAYDQSRHDFPS